MPIHAGTQSDSAVDLSAVYTDQPAWRQTLTRVQEAIQTLVRLFQRFEFELDGALNDSPPRLRPGITLGYSDGLWCRVHERP